MAAVRVREDGDAQTGGNGQAAQGPPARAIGRCVCGDVTLEIDVPAVWACATIRASRHAQGCAYATYIGCWRSKMRILEGEESMTRFRDATAHRAQLLPRCGTPLLYERKHAPKMVNIPRASSPPAPAASRAITSASPSRSSGSTWAKNSRRSKATPA